MDINVKQNLLNDKLHFSDSDTVKNIFRFQYENNKVYRQWCEMLFRNPMRITDIKEIPFLPVEIFKFGKVFCERENLKEEKVFLSSTTTSSVPSKHYVADVELYELSVLKNFERVFGPVTDYVMTGILPGYLHRGNASLVYMMEYLIKQSGNPEGKLFSSAAEAANYISGLQSPKKYFVLGVSYALMDLADLEPDFGDKEMIYVETGGMKGTRAELSRGELHVYLRKGLKKGNLYSEYGMTELLSQAWTKENSEYFQAPPWMKFYIRELSDPMSDPKEEGRGQLLILDMANVYSCSFLATQDIAELSENGMKLLGRTDYSEMRGCNLMYGYK
jgi:phenylacetate-coenzyme A ligase PaaK-like adenylate-forming protein